MTQKIIERLEEFKKAQVAHLVFNGINNSHKNKRNNNRFGEIPEDWKVVPTKSLFTFDKGLSITKADLTETGVPVLSYGQIHSKINSRTSIDDSLLRFVPKTIADAAPNSLGKKNGFIFADTSEDLDGCGNCNYIDRENVYAGYHTVLLNPRNTNEDYRYLSYLFQTDLWRHQIRKCLTEVKVYSISQKVLKSTWILLPSKKEQEEIVQRLEQMCKKINESKSAHADVIIKLEEYRKSIIYNAVTGKIDCRTEAVE